MVNGPYNGRPSPEGSITPREDLEGEFSLPTITGGGEGASRKRLPASSVKLTSPGSFVKMSEPKPGTYPISTRGEG
jgi:hypothetical protein